MQNAVAAELAEAGYAVDASGSVPKELTYEGVLGLAYLEAVFKEVTRLWPINPMGECSPLVTVHLAVLMCPRELGAVTCSRRLCHMQAAVGFALCMCCGVVTGSQAGNLAAHHGASRRDLVVLQAQVV